MRVLILKHASKSRPTGKWSANDYDVVERGQHGEKLVGRIMRTPQAPQAKFRSFTFDVHRHRCVAHQRRKSEHHILKSCQPRRPMTSSVTDAKPEKPNARAAAGVTSMTRPRTNGPRSLIRTTTE